ncbi:MAG TPA: hypothetical protein VIF62_04250 [Labilithrix sp.]|jgi:hypothetical protein
MRRVLLGAGILVALCAIAQACGSSDAATIGSGDDGGTAAPPPPPPGTDSGGGDASADADDDGPTLDLDGGGGDDAAPDGGACNGVVNVAPAITSRCRAGLPAFTGGALVAGTYHLVDVAVIATANYCANKFLAAGFRETAEVTVDGAGVATADTALQVATTGVRHATSTLAPSAGNTTPLHATPTCPAGAASDTPYTSAVGPNGKQFFEFVGKYGTGVAIYRLEKQ